MNKLAVGNSVRTSIDNVAYYDSATIPAGTVGTLAAIKCPCVCGPRKYFNCVDFVIDGKTVRAAYYNEQIKKVNQSPSRHIAQGDKEL